jgi:hypothetical protein
MSFDRDEFDKAKTAAAPKEDRRNLQMIQQAAVSADALTADPAWDKYLSYLQDAIEKNTKQRDAYINDLMNPLIVNPDEISKRRIAIIRLNERIDILTFVIAMPNQIKRLGEIAAKKLEVLTEIEESQAA